MNEDVYCTLFDKNYLSRGLIMIESLLHFQPLAKIIVFAFDQITFEVLRSLHFEGVTAVSLAEFEDQDLRNVKSGRTHGEYCWTATPAIVLFCLEKFNVKSVTYLDADLRFYSDPGYLFVENKQYSIWITSHRYTPKYEQSETSGKYCVQFVHFKNDFSGVQAAKWWRDRCLEWCYARYENGRFGDQKYLDDWLTRFESVVDIQNIGVGVAPWNMQQYEVDKNYTLKVIGGSSVVRLPITFFHFHGFSVQLNCMADLGSYAVPKSFKQYIYVPYFQKLLDWDCRLSSQFGVIPGRKENMPFIRMFVRRLKGTLNMISPKL